MGSLTGPIGLPESTWTLPDPGRLPCPTTLRGLIAFDFETYDPGLFTLGPGWPTKKGGVVGLALAWGPGDDQGVYLPWGTSLSAEEDPDRYVGEDRETIERWVQGVLDESERLVAHNMLYDLGWSKWTPWRIPTTKLWCTQQMASLLNEYRRSYKLDALLQAEFGIRKDEALLSAAGEAYGFGRNAKGALHKLPARYVGAYGSRDAVGTWRLADRFWPELVAQDLVGAATTERDLVTECLWPMRTKGVRVDVAQAAKDYEHALQELARIEASPLLGGIGVWGPELPAWLATTHKYPLDKTAQGQYSLTKATLKRYVAAGDERMAMIARGRTLDRFAKTFVKAYVLDKAVDGRLYPEFHPLRSDEGGAITGRFSASHPNLQNLPKVNEEADEDDEDLGRAVRGYFLPEEDGEWWACDYSQQEPRLALHFASVLGLQGTSTLVEAYKQDASTDCYQLLVNATGLKRSPCKILFLGRIYGMGDGKMCASMGYPTKQDENGRLRAGPEGQEVINLFNTHVRWARELSWAVQDVAKKRGFIWTYGRRRARYHAGDAAHPYVDPKTTFPVSPHKMLNKLIQGSAADQTKQAMVAIAKAGLAHVLRVPVHDELGLAVTPSRVDEGREAVRLMIETSPLAVPNKVDTAIGPSWGRAVE